MVHESREAALEWTAWKPLEQAPSLTPDTLAEWLDGGQAFRWNRRANGDWRGIWSDRVVEFSLRKDRLHWRAPEALKAGAAVAVADYLALGAAQSERLEKLPWRSDAHLRLCIEAFPGLGILRQPFGETLLCFLCSATKQIVQIKQMVQLLAERHGAELVPGIHRLPTWQEIAAVSETALRECLLGFRARYIHQTAQFLAQHDGWLEETAALPYAEAKARLCLLPGVGEKVADCVLLFGAGKLEAFPVDVWIIKTMERRYGLDRWKPAQIAHFGRVHFGAGAGLAQQFLFAWERKAARDARSQNERPTNHTKHTK
ncbi:MAG TPA: DNA glycosylase [Opitutaceae bacterium]|nr:DNA glycosylase [Opitutaceae bacterium]